LSSTPFLSVLIVVIAVVVASDGWCWRRRFDVVAEWGGAVAELDVVGLLALVEAIL